MRIANPIYDIVFKHLMEDNEIAIGIVSRLLGVRILEMTVQPQEVTQRQAMGIGRKGQQLRIYRVDFVATIAPSDGNKHKVLIELQKAHSVEVLGRFRNYLSRSYAVPPEQVTKEAQILPIIAIYLLGFELNSELPKVIKIERKYLDGVSGRAVKGQHRDSFIECLTHDAVVVQIPKIDDVVTTDLERLLQVFDQRSRDKSRHFLTLGDKALAIKDKLMQRLIRLLAKVAADDETQEQMQLEDELVSIGDELELA